MFDRIYAMVTGLFGVSSLPKDKDGKSTLTTDMERQITEKWGEKFLQSFKTDLEAAEADGNDPAKNADVQKLQKELKNLKEKFEKAEEDKTKLEDEKKELEGKIEILSKEEELDNPDKVEVKTVGKGKTSFKPNMKYMHNKVIDNYFNGDGSMQYSTNETIETSELQEEFGRYVTHERLEILRSLTYDLTCTQHMTTVVTDLLQWKATQAIIDDVLQQFTPYWTPSKKVKFTPIVINQYILKVNQPIKPADIIDQYIGYLYDENLTPDQMPIVKYIINQLVLPKLLENLEFAMAIGEFVEFTPNTDGTPAPVNASIQSMDGYLTVLRKLKASGNTDATWLLDGVVITKDNIIEQMDNVVDQVKDLYRNKRMSIHADPDLIRMYRRAYREKYKELYKPEDVEDRLDFSLFSFVPMSGMTGTGAFFLTPKENFKHLMSRNPNSAKIFMQLENYDVKIFMEFRKGTGFAMAEAIFAYLPPGSGSGSQGGGL